MSRLIETIQVRDGILRNSIYHQERMDNSSLDLFGAKPGFHLASLKIPDDARTGLVKCRIIYDPALVEIEFQPYLRKVIKSLKLVENNTINYNYKFEDRTEFQNLLKQKGEAQDILIARNGNITDTSFSNIVFRKGTEFYTPSTFLLNGTKRRQLIHDGMIKERMIRISDIASMDSYILINAMLDLATSPELGISSIIF